MSTREHGTRTKYVHDKCRCVPCRQANSAAEMERARQTAYGRWQPYVDAEPARRHVRRLGALGMGWKRVALAAGLSPSTVWKLLYGNPSIGRAPNKRVRSATAEAILAVELDLADGAVIEGTGTTRRIQALVSIGWSQSYLASRLGVHATNFTHLARGDRDVQVRTARAVAALYDELSMTPRAPIGHREKISVSRALNYAAAAGWLPPLAWDDDCIDDPDALPDTTPQAETTEARSIDEAAVLRAVSGDRDVRLGIADRREVVRILHGRGLSDQQASQLTGMSDKTVLRIRQELSLPANRTKIDWSEYGETRSRRVPA